MSYGRKAYLKDIEASIKYHLATSLSDGPALVFIDYLQNISFDGYGNKSNQRYEELNEISLSLAEMADRYQCAIVALAQLGNPNQAGRTSKNELGVYKAPNIFDITGSKQMVKDCGVAATFYKISSSSDKKYLNNKSYKVEDYGRDIRDPDHNIIQMDIVKSRYAKIGSFEMYRTSCGGFWSQETLPEYWGRLPC